MVQQIVQSSLASSTMGFVGKPTTSPFIWFVDSGASHCMTNSFASLQNIKHVSGNHNIRTTDGVHMNNITASGIGKW